MCYSNPDSNWNRSLCQSCMSMHIMKETWVLCFHVRSPRKHLSGSNLRAFRIPFICTRSVFHFLFFLSLTSDYLHNKRRAHDDEYAQRLRRTDWHTLFATLAANKQARHEFNANTWNRDVGLRLIESWYLTANQPRGLCQSQTQVVKTSKRLTPCHTFSLRLERIGKQWSWINREGIHY